MKGKNFALDCKMNSRATARLQAANRREENAKIGFNDLVRDAAQYGLIDNPSVWMDYRRARNITSQKTVDFVLSPPLASPVSTANLSN